MKNIDENGTKEIDINKLKKQNKTSTPFCFSKKSRIYTRELLKRGESFEVPEFDSDGFNAALLDLFIRHQTKIDANKLLQDIYLINDTFIFPASTLSLIIFDDDGKPQQVSNINTNFSNIKKKLSDWKLNKKNSIASLLSKKEYLDYIVFNSCNYSVEEENSILLLPSTKLIADFDKHSNDYEKRGDAVLKHTTFLKSTNFSIFKNSKGEYDYPIDSALLFPLTKENKLHGMLFLGYPILDLFFFKAGLSTDDLIYIKQLKDVLGELLDKQG